MSCIIARPKYLKLFELYNKPEGRWENKRNKVGIRISLKVIYRVGPILILGMIHRSGKPYYLSIWL